MRSIQVINFENWESFQFYIAEGSKISCVQIYYGKNNTTNFKKHLLWSNTTFWRTLLNKYWVIFLFNSEKVIKMDMLMFIYWKDWNTLFTSVESFICPKIATPSLYTRSLAHSITLKKGKDYILTKNSKESTKMIVYKIMVSKSFFSLKSIHIFCQLIDQ